MKDKKGKDVVGDFGAETGLIDGEALDGENREKGARRGAGFAEGEGDRRARLELKGRFSARCRRC